MSPLMIVGLGGLVWMLAKSAGEKKAADKTLAQILAQREPGKVSQSDVLTVYQAAMTMPTKDTAYLDQLRQWLLYIAGRADAAESVAQRIARIQAGSQ